MVTDHATCMRCNRSFDLVMEKAQGCIAHSDAREVLLLNVWQAYNCIAEAAVLVGFKSSILDLEAVREEQAAELLVVREALAQTQGDAVNLEKTLSMITGASSHAHVLYIRLPSHYQHRISMIQLEISTAQMTLLRCAGNVMQNVGKRV